MGLFNDEEGKINENSRMKLLEIFGFGNWESANCSEELHKKRADMENLKIRDKTPQIEVEDNHTIHIKQHSDYLIGETEMDNNLKERLNAHIREHRTYMRLIEEANNI